MNARDLLTELSHHVAARMTHLEADFAVARTTGNYEMACKVVGGNDEMRALVFWLIEKTEECEGVRA